MAATRAAVRSLRITYLSVSFVRSIRARSVTIMHRMLRLHLSHHTTPIRPAATEGTPLGGSRTPLGGHGPRSEFRRYATARSHHTYSPRHPNLDSGCQTSTQAPTRARPRPPSASVSSASSAGGSGVGASAPGLYAVNAVAVAASERGGATSARATPPPPPPPPPPSPLSSRAYGWVLGTISDLVSVEAARCSSARGRGAITASVSGRHRRLTFGRGHRKHPTA